MRPSLIFAVIWIGWIVSWIAAAFWSARTEKRVATGPVWVSRLRARCRRGLARCIRRGGYCMSPALACRLRRRLCARRCHAPRHPVRLVGADSSRPAVVEHDHPQGRPSRRRHRAVRVGSPSDLYRTDHRHRRDRGGASNRNRSDRRGADCVWALAQGAGRRGFPHRRTRRRRLRRLSPAGSDAGAVSTGRLKLQGRINGPT